MNKSFLGTSTLILVILTAGLVFDAGSAAASGRGSRKSSRTAIHNPGGKGRIAVAGIVSGSLEGRVKVGNTEVLITKETRLYKSGKGAVKRGDFVVKTPIYVTCERKNGVNYAKLVVIAAGQASDRGGETGIHETGTSR